MERIIWPLWPLLVTDPVRKVKPPELPLLDVPVNTFVSPESPVEEAPVTREIAPVDAH